LFFGPDEKMLGGRKFVSDMEDMEVQWAVRQWLAQQPTSFLSAEFFAGGLQTLHAQNPYDDEKGESRTPTSCATTPG